MTGRASRLDFWVEERSYTHSASWEVYDSTPSEGGVFANNDIDMPVWFNRGYTGHACPELGRREHLLEFDLINMNGRLYDPIAGRMLSADNHVQSPGNSQSYNRYAYVMNNPMKYTDPSGEFWIAAAAASVVAGISYLVGASRNDWEMDPRKWTSGDAVGIGFTTNSAGTTNLYGFGNAGGVSWTGGAGLNGDGFGGGLSAFGQASYNQMPSAGTGSINMQGVERAYQHEYGFWDNSFNKIPELSFEISAPSLGGELSTAYLASTAYDAAEAGVKKGYNFMYNEMTRQNNFNNKIRKPGTPKHGLNSIKVPNSLKFIGKYGGSVFTIYGVYDVDQQWRTNEISTTTMMIEQASNGIGLIPGFGTGWGWTWDLGKSYGPSKWYGKDNYRWFK